MPEHQSTCPQNIVRGATVITEGITPNNCGLNGWTGVVNYVERDWFDGDIVVFALDSPRSGNPVGYLARFRWWHIKVLRAPVDPPEVLFS